MSEEIDLNTNNLCTTADAFEQFQATSMYEEDEYITLSDLMSPHPQPPDLTLDIPFENEVVLESQLEEQVPEVNSTIEIVAEDIQTTETSAPHSEVPVLDELSAKSKSKRGRKKKLQQNDSILTDKQNYNEQQDGQLPPKLTPSSNKRRGRKPGNRRTSKTNNQAFSNGAEAVNHSTDVLPNSLSNPTPQASSASENEIASVGRFYRKPGRPRKEEETRIVNTEQNVPKGPDNTLNSNVPKRGRRKQDITKNHSQIEKQLETSKTELYIDESQSGEVGNTSQGKQDLKRTNKSLKKQRKVKKVHKENTLTDTDKADITTTVSEDDEFGDDICLSKLKQTLEPIETDVDNGPNKKCEPMEMEEGVTNPQFLESNVELPNTDTLNTDKVENGVIKPMTDTSNDKKEGNNEAEFKVDVNDSLLVEDTSKRPTRRKVQKSFLYDDGSDEDPYANVESSDEEPKKSKKGKKYYSDDEYVPGKSKHGNVSSSDVSDSDIDMEIDELMMSQRRKKQKLDSSLDKSPRKRGRKPKSEKLTDSSLEVKTVTPNENKQDDDIEICLQSSHIKADDDSKKKLGWGMSNEFENFIAKRIQGTDVEIKKAKAVQPLDIPVLDQNVPKKTVETSVQTTQIATSSAEVQTCVPYDLPMKDNIELTTEQAENACEFLKGIVKTTAELGQLMTQKSEDFIKKKINTSHVTDTFKMDYCVRKSYLLFKLAKHNLMQMEEDLSKQYDEFLNKNDLMKYREKPKELTPVKKADDGDSDCEIIDAPAPASVSLKPKKEKITPKFNPKTVFLNKELSIKIAKKPSEEKEKKLDIKGRHTVWISDSVMVKKVKPTQSFLAQDSRNKKPPDCVTLQMVKNFFEEYNRQQSLLTCAPFVTTEWLSFHKRYICGYFVTKPDEFQSTSIPEMPNGSAMNTNPGTKMSTMKSKSSQHSHMVSEKYNPRSLLSLCTQVLQNCLARSNHKQCETENLNVYSTRTIQSPQNLYSICLSNLQCILNNINGIKYKANEKHAHNALPLKTLCLQKITKTMDSHNIQPEMEIDSMSEQNLDVEPVQNKLIALNIIPHQEVKPLFSLCVTCIRNNLNKETNNKRPVKNCAQKIGMTPDSLKNITYKNIINLMSDNKVTREKGPMRKVKSLSDLCFEIVTKYFNDNQEKISKDCLTINSINRLTEEAFLNMDESTNITDNLEYYEDTQDTHFYDDEDEADEHVYNDLDEINNTDDNNWISQVEMKEFISIPNKFTEVLRTTEKNVSPIAELTTMTRIKTEPEEELEQIEDSAIVKTEPLHHNLDEMTVIPEGIMTNSESLENHLTSGRVQRKGSGSYDVDTFEAFVRSNKMMHALNELDSEEIFSQSASRIRRQYEPDSDPENDMEMSLLVPQTFEPMFIENAKDTLMESSDDENNSSKKSASKKKTDRRKTKAKKAELNKSDKQLSSGKTSTKEKQPLGSEIAVLTRRMRDKIRQEEKKITSSDSETENNTVISKKVKETDNTKISKKVKDTDNILSKETTKEMSKTKQKISKSLDDEIQCNNVDSTEQLPEQKKCDSPDPSTLSFSGFSAIDQNEVLNYQKYVKYVYDKILPSEESEPKAPRTGDTFFHPEEPVELLECEPTMPVFDNEDTNLVRKTADVIQKDNTIKASAKVEDKLDTRPFKTRDSWKCYELDTNDPKLYLDSQIVLEKLPESFVDTYFMYQNISDKNKEDDEVDRLINLQSLNRSLSKEQRGRGRPKKYPLKDQMSDKTALDDNNTESRVESPTFSDPGNELTPSEDENEDRDEPTTAKKDSSENTLAKSSLMDDHESDEESGVTIKKETPDEDAKVTSHNIKRKAGPKSKCKPLETIDAESMMLTADKMMNRELNLLHAPILPDVEPEKTPVKGPVTRNRQKSGTKGASHSKHVKEEDGVSSSEEEKHQWFTIKEKLLKKMINKKDTTREDDAKRAKLVNEFIERRGDLAENYLKRRKGGRSRRSIKKMLERQKQYKVLSRELFGDVANDPTLQGKAGRHSSYFKGRRNIRKVLDKKSLAKSTVLANMEEFERKRRLNIKQNKLREVLGCEEGVNVLVINDEVCLEYDFETHQPVVTIHPFFTKVMKAHQYEGVKFMWDACFESLESVESGYEGSGCILAHCMGLGKTLQVLALLHTVLTHPRVGMQRVLVCCPLSTVLNWVDEIHKWIGPVTDQIKVFELSKLKKTYERAYQLEDWYKGGGIFIIGYELFRSLTTLDPYLDDVRPVIVNKIRNALLDPGPDIIICDEGHLLKNDCSVLAVAMSRVKTARRIVLTGTPMQNNLREYYCMVNFVKPNLLGTYAEYSNRFENPIMNGQHRDSLEEDIKLMKARTHILHKVLEGCLQRQEASVLYPYLPKKHEYTVFVSLSKCQWDLYKHYMDYCTSNHSNKNNSVLKDYHILQKIWTHPQVLHNFQQQRRSSDDIKRKAKIEKLEDDLAKEDLNAEDIKPSETDTWWLQYLEGGEMLDSLHSSNKFVCIFRILEECIALGDKLLIFSTSLFTMDALEYFLKKIKSWSLGKEYYRLDGSVPAEVRQKWCREFNAEQNINTKLFLISTRAGCLGLNMTAANRVIILDTSWNPAHDIQSIFRVYRFGQKKDCYIYRLVALGTMEQKIYERSVTKQAVACRVVDEQQIDRHYNSADLTELYKYDESGVGVAGGVAVGVSDVVLLRVARDANLHAVHEHDSLLRAHAEHALPEHERNAAWMQFQQEHAHTQMQENLFTAPSQLIVQRMQGHDYAQPGFAQLATVKTENDDDAAAFKTKLDKKKGSKKSVVSCCIPIQPQPPGNTCNTLDKDKEEELISKITHLLIQHNFHVRQKPHEIAALVNDVRSIVASGRFEDASERSVLSASIANLLLQNELPMRQLTNIVCESVNKTIDAPAASSSKEEPKPKGKTKGKKRPAYVYEEIKPVEKEVEVEYDGRRRRRAALQAEKSFDKITDGTNDVNDESDTDFVPDHPVKIPEGIESRTQDVTVKEEPNNDDTRIKIYENAKRSDINKTASNSYVIDKETKILHQEMNSILLSDDDEPPPPKRKPGPLRKTRPQEKVDKEKMIKTESKVSENEEVYPLHPSLLGNQNFIKIVAHTYLSGNPMLDEDAATLAAQYSTQKALKEYEAYKKPITSGPLHDIAVKVLGMPILKKLHHTKGTIPDKSAAPPAAEPEEKAEEPAEKAEEITLEPPKPVPKKTIKLTIRVPRPTGGLQKASEVTSSPVVSSATPMIMSRTTSLNLTNSVATLPARMHESPAQPANVVPVGFYRLDVSGPPLAPWTPVNINSYLQPSHNHYYGQNLNSFIGAPPASNSTHQSNDECILPDDEDIHIISDPIVPNPVQPQPVVFTSQPQPIAFTSQPQQMAYISQPQLVAFTSQPAPVTVSNPLTASSNRRNAIKMVLNKVQSGQSTSNAPETTVPSNIVQLPPHSAPRILMKQTAMLANPAVTSAPVAPIPTVDPNTISLDSDDEDLLPSVNVSNKPTVATPPVVPVSLTTASSLLRPKELSTLTSNTSTPPTIVIAPKPAPVILNTQYDSGSTAPNPGYIMVANLKSKLKFTKRADLPPGAVPLSLNTAKSLQIGPQPVNDNSPTVNLENEAESILPVSAPMPPTTESLVNRSTRLENVPQMTAKCRPGDILRISKTGEIEVLNRADQDVLAGKIALAAPPSKQTSAPEPITIDLDEPPVSAPALKLNASTKKYEPANKRQEKKPVVSGPLRTKQNSSHDPLSILKDVIHIEADDYTVAQSSNQDKVATKETAKTLTVNCGKVEQPKPASKTPSTTPKSGPWRAAINTKETKTTSSPPKPTTRQIYKSLLSNIKSAPTKTNVTGPSSVNKNAQRSSNAGKDKTVAEKQSNRTIIVKGSDNKKNETKTSDISFIDITSCDPGSPRADTSKGKSKVLTGSTIVGTSKDIILCGAGKAIKRPQPTPVQQTMDKKRQSTSTSADTAAAKKKKTDKPMTLKDFDIDDIDDIIELD